MLVKVNTAAVQGLEAIPVTTEVDRSRGVQFYLVGLPDNAVKESYQRIVAAVKNSGYHFPVATLTVNLTPADLKKEGLLSDLSVELFEKIISYTIIEHNGTVSIVLKNGNRIERTEEYDNGYGIRRKNSNGYPDKT